MGPILLGCYIVTLGDDPRLRSRSQLGGIIRTLSGCHLLKISSQVTHVLCTLEEYERNYSSIRIAEKYGASIVSYDWLQDSIDYRSRLSETAYSIRQLALKQKQKQNEQQIEQQKRLKAEWELEEEKQGMSKPCRASEARLDGASGSNQHIGSLVVEFPVEKFYYGHEQALLDLGSCNHHFYRDDTAFIYNITLTRPHISQNINERYQLRLYEHISGPPFYYATFAIHTFPGRPTQTTLLSPIGSQFCTAFASFRAFFALQTGVDWQFRPWAGLAAVRCTTATELPTGCGVTTGDQMEDRYFTYILPDVHAGEAMGNVRSMEGVSRWGNPVPTRSISAGVVRALQPVQDEPKDEPEVKRKVTFKKEEGVVKKEPQVPKKRAYRPFPDRSGWNR